MGLKEELQIRPAHNPAEPDVIYLVEKSDEYLQSLYPPESNHAEPIEELMSGSSSFFLGYLGAKLVACGAVKLFFAAPAFAEIKRLYVTEEHRGRGFAAAILHHLEEYAKRNSIHVMRLEAGPLQPEALSLYRKLGYSDRGPFGEYTSDPLSVFMEKKLPR